MTFSPLLDPAISKAVRAELAWVAGVLGEARDAEVMRARLAAAVAAEPARLVVGPVATRIDNDLSARYRVAHARAVEALDSERYRRLLHDVETLVAAPPWTRQGRRPARSVLREAMRGDWKRLQRRVTTAARATDSAEHNERLHQVRKAAKRARYTAETLEPVFGRDARRLAKAARRLQSALGEHHDCVVAQALLRRLARQAHASGEDTFSYGLLHAREESRAAACEREFVVAWQSASRAQEHRWHG